MSRLRVCRVLLFSSLWAFGFGLQGSALAASQETPPSYDSKGKRDPFVALVHEGRFVGTGGTLASASQPSDLQLVGILWDPGGRSIALINDAEVTVGEVVGDYQVVDIQQDAVTVMREGKPIILQLSFENHELTPE